MWRKPRSTETPEPSKPFVFAVGDKTLVPIAQMEPIPRIIQAVIVQALRENAVAIQFLPQEDGLRVEFLCEEAWIDTMKIPQDLQSAIVTHLKEMAGLPVWEHRMALQGLILFRVDELDFDIAISVVPTRHGEKITLHIAAAEDAPD